MKIYFVIPTICLYLLFSSSCETDYDIDKHFEGNFSPRVVVNSIISPNSPITAQLCWSKYYADTTDYINIEAFDVEIYENDKLISERGFLNTNGRLSTTIIPKEGNTYQLKITVPNYGEVNASTYIPFQIETNIEKVIVLETEPDENDSSYMFMHFRISNISSENTAPALWITSRTLYYQANSYGETPNNIHNPYLYSNNIFADKLNARQSFWQTTGTGSNIRYRDFIRVAHANFDQATPLDFSVEVNGKSEPSRDESIETNEKNAISSYVTIVAVNLITPSTDYDRYKESISESYQFDPFGSGGTAVYSNIENGLGIFAGYNYSTLAIGLN